MDNNDLKEKLEQLEKQKKELQSELRRYKRKPNSLIGFFLLFFGLILIIVAIVYSHYVSAFIGISLTFWGALLFYIRPIRFIRKDILDSAVLDPIVNINKLLNELEFKGTPIYVSPGTLRGFSSTTIYIPRSIEFNSFSDEYFSNEGASSENPPALKLTPPGMGLSKLLEDELGINFATVDLEYLKHNLEKALVEGLEIVETFEMNVSNDTINVEIKGSIFDEIVKKLDEQGIYSYVSDPLSSAIACILSRSTRRSIIISKVERNLKTGLTKIVIKYGDSYSRK